MQTVVLALLTLIVAGCTVTPKYTAEEIQRESAAVRTFFDRTFKARLQRSPMFQTYLGIKENYGQLDDNSEANTLKEAEIFKAELKELRQFNFAALDESAKMNYRLFEYFHQRRLAAHEYRHYSYPVNQMFGVQSELPSLMINMHLIENEQQARDYISRLKQFERYLGEVVQGLKRRAARGVVAPRFVYPKVIRDSRNVISGQPFAKGGGKSGAKGSAKSPLWADFEKKLAGLKLPRQRQRQLLKDAKAALRGPVRRGFENLIAYLETVKDQAPVEGGASSLPGGREYYEMALRYHTSTTLSADEIHQTGLDEVARIHNEMRAIMKTVGFKGQLQDFFNHMRTSEQFRYPDSKSGREAYIEDSKSIIGGMKARLGELFNLRPKADIIVKAVEPYREKSAGLAFYSGPSLDGTRPGTFYVNLSNMAATTKYELEALAYHEGIPGHHMQVAITRELKDLPDFRKHNWMTAFGEGWALYSELLPKEIGLYRDPYADFGRLSMELLRAVRLVVDTGVHAKGWTRVQGIEYMMSNMPVVYESARKSVERYLVMPGQATAYKVGMLKILELRAQAKERLGASFDIRRFHDEVLRHGPVPFDILEENIETWSAQSTRAIATE